jgi:hypothetical protein
MSNDCKSFAGNGSLRRGRQSACAPFSPRRKCVPPNPSEPPRLLKTATECTVSKRFSNSATLHRCQLQATPELKSFVLGLKSFVVNRFLEQAKRSLESSPGNSARPLVSTWRRQSLPLAQRKQPSSGAIQPTDSFLRPRLVLSSPMLDDGRRIAPANIAACSILANRKHSATG